MKQRSKGEMTMRICKDTSQSKKTIFKANLKLCETKFSRGYIDLAHLLTSKSKMGKQRKRAGQKTGSREQSCQAPQTEGRIRNMRWRYQDAGTHTTHGRNTVPGSDVRWRGIRQNPPTEDSHCQVTHNDTLHKPSVSVQMSPFRISPALPFTPVLLQT